MSVFGNIMSSIFSHPKAQPAPEAPQQPLGTAATSEKTSGPAPAGPVAAGTSSAKTTAPAAPQRPSSAAATSDKTFGPAPAGPAPAGASSATTAAAPTAAAPTAAAARAPFDVEAVLNDLASKNTEKLDWRHSIVDLMKLLNLDSGLSARQELAKELHYTGETKDTASMNIWLHKQVMIKLAENGGKVPDSLRA